jgi:ABC-type lipoprotein export system ATPase subunit/GNAT superfamily N-acetyltransferase
VGETGTTEGKAQPVWAEPRGTAKMFEGGTTTGVNAGGTLIECVRTLAPIRPSPRVAEVAMKFGVTGSAAPRRVLEPLSVPLVPGQIIAFVGPSGSGKSSALAQIETQYAGGHNVQRVSLPPDRALVDCVTPHTSLTDALSLLTACALGEAPLWLRRYDELSEGEKFRARLAKAIGLHARGPAAAPLLCDEFCTGLHRRAAKAIAYNLRKLVTRRGLCVVLATSHEDVLPDLQPDATVHLRGDGSHRVTRQVPRRRPISFWRGLVVEPGCKRDYQDFATMHYRTTDELGFVDKVFVLRERAGGEPLGIVVYSHGPMELALRNQATQKRFCRNPALLNREVRILRRLVIHPDVRGCGLGYRLVRRTLPLVGTRYVECLAAMGAVNPVFEMAGMQRIGLCSAPREQAEALEALRALDVDPFAPDFESQVCRSPRLRSIVARLVFQWYRATTGGGEHRVRRQSPQFLAQVFRSLVGSRPVYYLWERKR